MAITAPHLAPLELRKPPSPYNVELARRMLDLVEIRHQLIVGQRSVINDQQTFESGPQLAHVATHPNMRATLHRATDTQTNDRCERRYGMPTRTTSPNIDSSTTRSRDPKPYERRTDRSVRRTYCRAIRAAPGSEGMTVTMSARGRLNENVDPSVGRETSHRRPSIASIS